MFRFFRERKSVRFLLISAVLTSAALAAAFISAAAAQMGEYDLASVSSKVALALALGIVLYVVPRLARNFRLEYLRVYRAIHVPPAGLIFGALALMVMVAAFSTGNNLLYLVLAALIATWVVSWGASRLTLSRVGVTLRFPDHIFAGEPAELEVTLVNQKRLLPSFSLTVAVTEGGGERPPGGQLAELAHFAVVPGGGEGRARLERSFARRGVYPVRGFTMSTRFPFGFVERRRLVEANGEIVVYPSPQPLDDFYHLLPMTQGQMESPARGMGSDLYAIRQYLPSDHPRHVDWKATAKTARLMVREFTRDDDWRVTVALDTQPSAAADFAAGFERAVTLAASLITHLMAEGAELRLLAGREDLGFGHSPAHRYAMLRQLARLAPEAAEAAPDGGGETAWGLLERLPALVSDDQFKILITPAARGSIPAVVWRSAHVVYFEDL